MAAVELDALAPSMLKDMCRRVIERHIDLDALRVLREAELLNAPY
jgi:hypothetical protein